MAEILLKNVNKKYGNNPNTIQDVNLQIGQGEFCVFVGPSGCGKSTLLRMIAGLEDITSGDLYIGGKRMNEKAPSERGVSMVFQSYALYPHMTVRENMAFGLKIAKTDKSTIEQKVNEAARILQLDKLLDRLPKELSGGQRQRVAVARALVNKPSIILADEPTGNLDSKTSVEIMNLFNEIHANGNTVILVTHEEDIAAYAHRIIRLRDGLIESDTINQNIKK